MQDELMLSLFSFIFMIILIACQVVSLYVSRKDIYLGIRIPQDERKSSEVKAIGKSYVRANFIIGVPTAIILSYLVYKFMYTFVYTASIFVFIFIDFIIYYFYNRKMAELKREKGWLKTKKQIVVIDTSFSKLNGEKIISGSKWFAISIIFIIVCIIINIKQYPSLPKVYPTHWAMNGKPNGYTYKSYMSIFSVPIQQVVLTVIMFISYKMIVWSKREIDAKNPEESKNKNIKCRNIWIMYTVLVTFVMQIIFMIEDFQVMQIVKVNTVFITIFVLAISFGIGIVSIIIAIKVGQGGSRLKEKPSDKNFETNVRDDDKYWKLGNTIYYNKNDPSIFIEKRFGIGWTVNAGTKIGMLFYIATVAIIIVAIAMSIFEK
ncbi:MULTISPECIES: DUF1648 domain-containing protein [Clostridium]|uniref:DUF1648 domain-containing protein n=1 Tax=Clostridium TaxID=1485 RepID=UPI0008263EB6|nr:MULTISPECIES: DUF5808 domain-containing protein [Clostridium]PJI07759.1 DUF1648 domain-containing protein [Clostridium sp. CT7]